MSMLGTAGSELLTQKGMKKKKINSGRVYLLLAIILLTNSFILQGQNVSSPYSVLGIGDIHNKDACRYFASGNASLGRRDVNSYNYANPASLTALPFKLMNFDITTGGKNAKYSYPNTDTSIGVPSNDFLIKRITAAFKVSDKAGIAFGLKPYSSVNYLYVQDNAILDGNSAYFKLVEGDGGINQVYFSYARTLGKRLSVGATASWLFGTLHRNTQYISPEIALNVVRDEKDFYTGAVFQGSMQYYTEPNKKWRHQFGLTASVSTGLRGELTTEYTDGAFPVKKEVEKDRQLKLPVTIGIGYSAIKNERLTLSVEGNYYHWPYQKVNYTNSYTYPSARVSSGVEYVFRKKQGKTLYEKSYISAGVNVENSYLRINKNSLWDYSFSFGGGLNVARNLSLYSGIELGTKGNKNYNQIKERYTQFIIGLTLKDIWIGPRYARRYD